MTIKKTNILPNLIKNWEAYNAGTSNNTRYLIKQT